MYIPEEHSNLKVMKVIAARTPLGQSTISRAAQILSLYILVNNAIAVQSPQVTALAVRRKWRMTIGRVGFKK